MMDLNELVVFAKVAETRSFTAAATELGLPKSTVSRKIAQLEERLGARLLQRTTRKLALTDAGAAYFARCAKIVADILEADREVVDQQASPRGLVRLTASTDIASVFLGDILAQFVAKYPEITVELDASDRIVDLIDEGIDVGVRVGPLAESSLVARRLTSLSGYAVASPAYLAAAGTPTTPAELATHAAVTFVPNGRRAPWTISSPTGETAELGPNVRIASASLLSAVDATLAGAGIAMVPDFFVTELIRKGRLVRVLPEFSGERRDLYAVYPSTRNLAPRVRALVDHLIAAFDPPPWTRPPCTDR
jgi:DNA-binding transcriptional LysR family regulator